MTAPSLYDRPDFFAAYSRLARSLRGLDAAPEWPVLRGMLPDLRGRRVVDLGCGFGWFCRWAAAQGVARVLGLDVSEQMLARAAADTADPAVEYRQRDLEALVLPEGAFDLAYSSLALHYIADLERLIGVVHRALAPDGRLVFSIEHPIHTAPMRPGWIEGEAGRRIWALDSYSVEGRRVTDWLAPGVVKYHRTLGTILTLLVRTGFHVSHVVEFCPTEAQIAARPEMEEERDKPTFLLVGASR